LAHTNKKTDFNGNNVFAGVSDIIDDLDCAYVLDVKPDIDGKRFVKFTNKKRRGSNPDTIMVAYSADPEISYVDRVASVHETDVYGGGDETPLDEQTSDEDILESLGLAIRHGEHRGKMELIRMVASLHSVSKRRVLKLLEEATGNDPERHRWSYGVGARGLHVYKLLERDAPSEDA
jgi:hypothetical protein